MSTFDFDENTVLIKIFEAYPWLGDVLPKMDKRAAIINTPMGKMLMKRNTVADLAKLSGYPAEKLLERLRREVERYESAT